MAPATIPTPTDTAIASRTESSDTIVPPLSMAVLPISAGSAPERTEPKTIPISPPAKPISPALSRKIVMMSLFLAPYLTLNLMVTEKFASLFEFSKVVKVIFGNFKKYVIALLMTLFYCTVYVLLSVVLVGIPCLAFGSQYFLVEFYRTARS